MKFTMTDGRGIKGTSVGFVTRDLGAQNPFLSLVLEVRRDCCQSCDAAHLEQ